MENIGKLYLIPSPLSKEACEKVVTSAVRAAVNDIEHFIVENEKTTRRYLSAVGVRRPIRELTFYTLNKHTKEEEIVEMISPLLDGVDMGIISEAGCPGVADPGQVIVSLAHAKGIEVVPLVGPSSILLSLMASGLNGQSFVFHGYLPKEQSERISKIREIEKESQERNQTQIFIETPYRNNHMLEDLLESCGGKTSLSISCELTEPTEFIRTKNISEWVSSHRAGEIPDFKSKPCVFLLQAF